MRPEEGSASEQRPWLPQKRAPFAAFSNILRDPRIAPRTMETALLHKGTELQLLKCSFESLKIIKNCFLSPPTAAKYLIKPTCTAWGGGDIKA